MKILRQIIEQIRLTIKELRLVEWISLKQTMQSTLLILVISIFVGIIIVAFDTAFFEIRNIILEL